MDFMCMFLAQVEDFACGTYSSFALAAGGHVFAWGLNNYGQLALPGQVFLSAHAIPMTILLGHHKPPLQHYTAKLQRPLWQCTSRSLLLAANYLPPSCIGEQCTRQV